MQPKQFLKELSARLTDALPENLLLLKKDFEKNAQSILSSAFAKMDIVTREEFDAQTKVLARTRKKISSLEEQVAELEKKLQHNAQDQHD
jgi:ubiquinone biosynthesis accessory factor UbiK